MHLDWIGSPLALYGLLFVGLNACLALFLALKFELHATRDGAERSLLTAQCRTDAFR